jgi:hypothetical protein
MSGSVRFSFNALFPPSFQTFFHGNPRDAAIDSTDSPVPTT